MRAALYFQKASRSNSGRTPSGTLLAPATLGKDPAALEAGASRGRTGDERVRCDPFKTTAHDEVEDFT